MIITKFSCSLYLTNPETYFLIFPPTAIFERLRNILHESAIDKRVQYMIEVMFAIRKDGFKDHPVIPDGLDLVDEEDQFTHMMPLEDEYNTEDLLSESYC
jgi:pre-mRNA-splicing factor CWC22